MSLRKKVSVSAFALIAASTTASADTPKVVTDIAPIHSLVAQVMQGVGTPELLINAGTSPHDFALRPSQARALSDADLVFWIGEALTPSLEQPLENLAANAHVIELTSVSGTQVYEFREEVVFGGHDDHAGHEKHDDHSDHADHDDHDDHADHDDHHKHDEHADHDDHDKHDEHEHGEHAEEHDGHDDHAGGHGGDHHGHDHSGVDPHAWLSPANARVWLGAIAEELSEQDPENAALYSANAEDGAAALDALDAELKGVLAASAATPVLVFHDAYQYFDRHYDLNIIGAISLGDTSDPGAARIAELKEAVAEQGVTCVYSEPQLNPNLIKAVTEGVGVNVAELDPLGAILDPGPGLYVQMMRNMAGAMAGC